MDIDFYKGFDIYDTVSFNDELWSDILALNYLDSVFEEADVIPAGHDDAGEVLERVCLGADRNVFINDLVKLIIKYSAKARNDDTVEAISKILKSAELVNDEAVSHFKLDV